MSIVILSSNAFAEKCTSENSKRFSFTPDVGFGNEYKKSLGNNFKKHGVCIVEKSQGHPTRLGQQSLRFEVKQVIVDIVIFKEKSYTVIVKKTVKDMS